MNYMIINFNNMRSGVLKAISNAYSRNEMGGKYRKHLNME